MRYRSKAYREKSHANAVRRGKRSGEVRRARMLANGPRDDARPRLEAGEWIGEIQFREASGTIRRWAIRQARRRNQILIAGAARPHGWDWLLTTLREHLSPLTR